MSLSEQDIISTYFRPLAGPEGLDFVDDVALMSPPPGMDLVITQDTLVADVHFFPSDLPAYIAQKALRVNPSDLAAKGAKPLGFLLSLALPAPPDPDFLQGFAEGLAQDCATYGIKLIGGDTVRMPGPLTISITALGAVPRDRMPRRNQAHVGDHIYVSGTLGDAALGLLFHPQTPEYMVKPLLDAAACAYCIERYLLPQPRMGLIDGMLAYAHASMDLSDGLVRDLDKLLRASHLGADVRLDLIPYSAAARKALQAQPSVRDMLLTHGDDYELLFTAPPQHAADIADLMHEKGVLITNIGEIKEAFEHKARYLDVDGNPYDFPPYAGFEHF